MTKMDLYLMEVWNNDDNNFYDELTNNVVYRI